MEKLEQKMALEKAQFERAEALAKKERLEAKAAAEEAK